MDKVTRQCPQTTTFLKRKDSRSDESHFNVSLIVRDKVTRPCPQTTTLFKRKESRSGIETEVLPLTSLTPYRLTKPALF